MSSPLFQRTSGLGLLAGLFLSAAPAVANELDVQQLLREPGVKLVVVEFYATWCKPCMEAVPKWKALHDKYRKEGLRFIVVSTQDPQAGCTKPLAWTPDQIICDDDGAIAESLGVGSRLPAAFMWSWQGQMLSSRAHVEQVEARIEDWMRTAPRVGINKVDVPSSPGMSAKDLEFAVRAELQSKQKLVVVVNEQELAALRAAQKKSLSANADDSRACEVGKDLTENSHLNIVISAGSLYLQLLSAESKCLSAQGKAKWNAQAPDRSIWNAVQSLMNSLQRPTQLPGGRFSSNDSRVEVQTETTVKEQRTGTQVNVTTSFLVVQAEPEGATIYVDGQERGQGRVQLELPIGRHVVEARLGDLYKPVKKRVRLKEEETTRATLKLPAFFGILSVRSEPSGAEIFINPRLFTMAMVCNLD